MRSKAFLSSMHEDGRRPATGIALIFRFLHSAFAHCCFSYDVRRTSSAPVISQCFKLPLIVSMPKCAASIVKQQPGLFTPDMAHKCRVLRSGHSFKWSCGASCWCNVVLLASFALPQLVSSLEAQRRSVGREGVKTSHRRTRVQPASIHCWAPTM